MKRLILIVVVSIIACSLCMSCYNDPRFTYSGYNDPRFTHSGYEISAGMTSGFKEFTWENDIAYFSFEYKSTYKIDKLNTYVFKEDNDRADESCCVELIGPNDTRINIHVFPNNQFPECFTDAQSRVNYIVERALRFGDVDILEQSDVTISGIPGTLLVTEEVDWTRGIVGIYKGQKYKSQPKCIIREVNLDHKNQIWMITIDSMSSAAEKDKADFEHLLDTLKIY